MYKIIKSKKYIHMYLDKKKWLTICKKISVIRPVLNIGIEFILENHSHN
jgi:hypothetical protein